MSPTVGSIWARATRTVSLRGSRRSIAAGAAGAAPWRPVGSSRCERRRHLDRCLAGARCCSLAAGAARPRRRPPPEALHRAPRAADRRSPHRPSRPQPQRLHRPGGAAVARLHAPTSASTGSPRGSTRRTSTDANGDGVPDFVERVRGGRRTRLRGRERQARLARPEVRRPRGRRQRQDRHLPVADRRRAVRLRGARPRPGVQGHTACRAACTATWSSTTTTTRSSSRARRRSTTSR